MCGGDSDSVMGCADGYRDKTTPLGETSWRFGAILFGKHAQTQSGALLNGFIDYSREIAQGCKGIRGILQGRSSPHSAGVGQDTVVTTSSNPKTQSPKHDPPVHWDMRGALSPLLLLAAPWLEYVEVGFGTSLVRGSLGTGNGRKLKGPQAFLQENSYSSACGAEQKGCSDFPPCSRYFCSAGTNPTNPFPEQEDTSLCPSQPLNGTVRAPAWVGSVAWHSSPMAESRICLWWTLVQSVLRNPPFQRGSIHPYFWRDSRIPQTGCAGGPGRSHWEGVAKCPSWDWPRDSVNHWQGPPPGWVCQGSIQEPVGFGQSCLEDGED